MTGVEINEQFRSTLQAAGLDCFEKFMALPATNVVRAVPGRSTVRVEMGGIVGYLKRYEPIYFSSAKRFLRVIRWPGFDDEAAREWRKIHVLQQYGFLTALPMARGQRGYASFLLQQEITGGVPADEYLRKLSVERRRSLLKQIGALARRLRDAGFVHKDLYLKHIFVVECGAGWELYLIDLQRVLGPRRHRQRWYLKDAAALAYSVRAHAGCSRTDLLRVCRSYGADRKFIRQIWSRAERLSKRTPKYKRVWNG